LPAGQYGIKLKVRLPDLSGLVEDVGDIKKLPNVSGGVDVVSTCR
jgi:hypothetical protein